jgi:hypothetical protein
MQGFITQRVTNYLNLAGIIALLPLAWDTTTNDPRRWRQRLRWALWSTMALSLCLLLWLHPRLDALLDPETSSILERGPFRSIHQLYLNASSFQWGCGLGYLALSVWGWFEMDRGAPKGEVGAEEGPGPPMPE